jgi:hypothetical protein
MLWSEVMTRKLLGWAALLAVVGLAGCGQTSEFSVDVIVGGSQGRDAQKLVTIQTVEVKTTGAVSDESTFLLKGFPRESASDYADDPRDSAGQHIIGKFEYGTTADSGKVTFTVTLRDGALNSLGDGSADGTIQSGGNVALSVTLTPVSTW